jgi:hypothetical protein
LSFATFTWGLSGLEVGLVTLLTTGAVGLALQLDGGASRRTLGLLAVVLSLALLTRPDSLVLAAIVVAYGGLTARAGRRRTVLLTLGGAVVGTLVGLTVFRLVYYGDPLPNTYYLKLQGGDLSTRLTRGLLALGNLGVLSLYLPLVLGLAYFVLERPRRGGPYLLAGLVVGHCGYSVYAGGDAWEQYLYANRYITPVLPLLLVLAALGIGALLAGARGRGRRGVLGFAAASVALFPLLYGLAEFARWQLPRQENLSLGDPEWYKVRLAILVVAVLLLALPTGAGRICHPQALARRLAWPGLVVLLLIFSNGEPISSWLRHGGESSSSSQMVRYGLALRAATAPEARIAVVWAGAIPYFADRPAVDLLGKSDPVIAHGARRGRLHPGHDKWNYRYSIGELRPDVVAQIWHARDDRDVRLLASWGYSRVHERLEPDLYVRNDSTLVDRAALRSWVCRRARRPPGC